MLERRRVATAQVARRIEEVEETCAKVVDQVSQTWETLMDDEKSQEILNDLIAFEENITWIRNDMK